MIRLMMSLALTLTFLTPPQSAQVYNTRYRLAMSNPASHLFEVTIEVVVPAKMVDKTVDAVAAAAKTGKIGDGKIFVIPVEQAVRIRTSEIDESAL